MASPARPWDWAPTPDLSEPTFWTSAGLPDRLPPGRYRFAGTFSAVGATQLTLGWEYGSYRFTRYRKPPAEVPSLVAPAGTDLEYVRLASEALGEARDLINTPANDLGPAELGEAVQRLALQHEAECRIIVGEDLLRQNYPLIYEVGKGSAREPRLIDMRWGKTRRSAGDAGGQGRVLRHRRPRHQAVAAA